MADEQTPRDPDRSKNPMFIHCPECGDDITIQNPEAYILAIHLDAYCDKTHGWLHHNE